MSIGKIPVHSFGITPRNGWPGQLNFGWSETVKAGRCRLATGRGEGVRDAPLTPHSD